MTDFRNKKIILIVSFLLLTLLIGGFIFWKAKKVKTENKIINSEQIFQERQQEIDKAFIKPQDTKLQGVNYEPPKETDCDDKQGEEKIESQNYYSANLAFINKKPQECGLIDNPEIQYYCVMKFLAIDKDQKLCDILSYPSKQEKCIHYLAFALEKPELCESSNPFEKKECLGPFLAYQAAASGKVEECRKIDILEYSNLCFERIINNLDRNCGLLQDENDQVICQDIVTYETALDTKNIKACDLINEKNRKEVCINFLNKGSSTDSDQDFIPDHKELWFNTDPFKADSDGDGLNDGEEMSKYHTNPLNIDTDEDTFKDGDEVKNGFNPSGEGKLKLDF